MSISPEEREAFFATHPEIAQERAKTELINLAFIGVVINVIDEEVFFREPVPIDLSPLEIEERDRIGQRIKSSPILRKEITELIESGFYPRLLSALYDLDRVEVTQCR